MKFHSKILIFFLLIFLQQEILSKTNIVQLTNFRFSLYPNKIRLVFDVTGVVNYASTVFPDKIIIDIKKAKFTSHVINLLKTKRLTVTPISSITYVPYGNNSNNLHLNLHLKKPAKLHHFFLTKPDRVVFDLYFDENKNAQEPTLTLQSSKPPKLVIDTKANPTVDSAIAVNSEPAPITNTSESAMLLNDLEQDLIKKMGKAEDKDGVQRRILVVIDPGHGGMDSGAIGHNGTQEKNITLGVSKALQHIINNFDGFKAVLTRNGDYFIPLRERLAIAHNKKADMFISIHADAYINRSAHGISIFALSQRGATSEAARWIAEKENESELGQAISDKNNLLRSVLIDLAQTATISASLDIGGKILKTLSGFASLHCKEVEQAAFVVLKSPDIPSLLAEVGFLSYGPEEMKLRSTSYQKEIASRLASGIKDYFIRRPPPGTYLAKIKPCNNIKMTLQDSLPSSSSD